MHALWYLKEIVCGWLMGLGGEERSMCEVSVVERKLERVCEFKGLGICIR